MSAVASDDKFAVGASDTLIVTGADGFGQESGPAVVTITVTTSPSPISPKVST